MKKVENTKSITRKTTSKATKVAGADKKKSIAEETLDYTDAFIQEVNEDVKNENFKVLWNRYGVFVIAFVVIAVSAAVCFEKIKVWKVEQNQMKTETYMEAAQLKSNPEETLSALQKINQG